MYYLTVFLLDEDIKETESYFDFLYLKKATEVYTLTIHPDASGPPDVILMLEGY